MYESVDAVCAVLAPHRSRNMIDLVLTTFIPGYEDLNSDYASLPNDPSRVFVSADEMIDYFISNSTCAQTFFWNQYKENPDSIMVGAFFTTDERLIISLTLHSDGARESKYLARLKALLGSDVGVISYTDPPPFDDGADFIRRYGT